MAKRFITGKNRNGVVVLDNKSSTFTFIRNCQTCHGKNGDRMNGVSIKFSDLNNPKIRSVPYNDSLSFDFWDNDLKRHGTKANIGVIWKMSNQDKKDLLDYLKRRELIGGNFFPKKYFATLFVAILKFYIKYHAFTIYFQLVCCKNTGNDIENRTCKI